MIDFHPIFDPSDFWRFLSPGVLTMGCDNSAFEEEKPAHTVRITEGFWMGRYPVTNAEFQRFIDSGGYEEQAYWSEEGWRWLHLKQDDFQEWLGQIVEKHEDAFGHFFKTYDSKWLRSDVRPKFRRNSDYNGGLQPVVGVNWLEANAFCKWLSSNLDHGYKAVLPTEAQWEWAAKGEQNRAFPWGNEPLDIVEIGCDAYSKPSELVNCNLEVGRTTPVDHYPKGQTPEGIQDLLGNVWEWCLDSGSEDVDQERLEGVENPLEEADTVGRPLRGGSWELDVDYISITSRDYLPRWFSYSNIGFRCCVTLEKPDENA